MTGPEKQAAYEATRREWREAVEASGATKAKRWATQPAEGGRG